MVNRENIIILFIVDVILRAIYGNKDGLRELLPTKLSMNYVFFNLERERSITYVRYRYKPFLLESLLE